MNPLRMDNLRQYWRTSESQTRRLAERPGLSHVVPHQTPPPPQVINAQGQIFSVPVTGAEIRPGFIDYSYPMGPIAVVRKFESGPRLQETFFRDGGESEVVPRSGSAGTGSPASMQAHLPAITRQDVEDRVTRLKSYRDAGMQVALDYTSLASGSDRPFMRHVLASDALHHPERNVRFATSPAEAARQARATLSEPGTARYIAAVPDSGHSIYCEYMRHPDGKLTALTMDTMAQLAYMPYVHPALEKAALDHAEAIHHWTFMQPDVQRQWSGCPFQARNFGKASYNNPEMFQAIHLAMREGWPGPHQPDVRVLNGGLAVFYEQEKIDKLLPAAVLKKAEDPEIVAIHQRSAVNPAQAVNKKGESLPTNQARIRQENSPEWVSQMPPGFQPPPAFRHFQNSLPFDTSRINAYNQVLKDWDQLPPMP